MMTLRARPGPGCLKAGHMSPKSRHMANSILLDQAGSTWGGMGGSLSSPPVAQTTALSPSAKVKKIFGWVISTPTSRR